MNENQYQASSSRAMERSFNRNSYKSEAMGLWCDYPNSSMVLYVLDSVHGIVEEGEINIFLDKYKSFLYADFVHLLGVLSLQVDF